MISIHDNVVVMDGLHPSHRRWAADAGVTSDIFVAEFGGLRGAAAGNDLVSGDEVLSVPDRLLINQDTALESELVKPPASAIPLLSISIRANEDYAMHSG